MGSDLIDKIKARQSRNRAVRDMAIVACVISYLFLAGAALLFFSIPALIAFLGCSFLIVIWQLKSRKFFRESSDEDACRFIDSHFNLKDRTSSLLELKRMPPDSPAVDRKIKFIESQLDKSIPEFDPEEVLPLKVSSSLRFFSFSLPLVWLAIFIMLWSFDYSSLQAPGARIASKIEKLLADQPLLPEELKDDLQNLAQLLKTQDPGSEEVMQALLNAENSLRDSQERLAEQQSQGAVETIPEMSQPEEEEKEEQQPPELEEEEKDQKEEEEKSAQEEQQQKQEQEQQEQEEQQESEPEAGGLPDDDDGSEGGEETPEETTGDSDEASEPEDGEEEGDGSGAGEGDSGDEEGSAPGEGEGQDQGQGGSGEDQAPDAEGSGEGESGAQEESGEDASEPSGEGQQEGALADTEQMLSEIRKDIEEKQSQDSKKQQAEETGDSGKGKEEGDTGDDGAGDSEGEEQSEGPDGEKEDQSFEQAKDEEERAASESEAPGSSLSPSEGVKDFEDMEQGGDEPVEDLPGDFEETFLPADAEDFNPAHGEDAGRVLSDQDAESRISLEEVNLARPESLREQEEQAIPPEYRGILR